MAVLLDALTIWSIALRSSQPVSYHPSCQIYTDSIILALSGAQMWHTHRRRHAFARATHSVLFLALDLWIVDATLAGLLSADVAA
ncbi:hypothetical protein LTR10_012453 [Elasticomyces elasticus]|nr:hypothetical protein LTR10_012453 [Elasticomyces elasticus]KAK4965928.1 hypothetical protein LTR42_011942 [Elasticomyces elasticus]